MTKRICFKILPVALLAAMAAITTGCGRDLAPNPRFHQACREMKEAQQQPPEDPSGDGMAGATGVQIYNDVYLPSVTGDSASN